MARPYHFIIFYHLCFFQSSPLMGAYAQEDGWNKGEKGVICAVAKFIYLLWYYHHKFTSTKRMNFDFFFHQKTGISPAYMLLCFIFVVFLFNHNSKSPCFRNKFGSCFKTCLFHKVLYMTFHCGTEIKKSTATEVNRTKNANSDSRQTNWKSKKQSSLFPVGICIFNKFKKK